MMTRAPSLLGDHAALTRQGSRYALALVGVLIIAAILRLVALGSLPAGLSHDEAVKGYDAWSVLHTGRDQYGERFPLVFRAIGDYREALMPYLIAASEAAFGPTDFAVRLPAALAGIALVAAACLLGTELFGRPAGLLAAAFLAISPWHVQVSRLAFRAGLTPLCITLGLWLLLRALRRGGSLVPAGLVLGLSLHTYLGARAFLPLLLAGIALIYRKQLMARPRAALAGGATLVLVAAPLLLWGLAHPADFAGHAGASGGWREAGGPLPFAAQVARKYLAYLGPGNLVLHGDPYPVPSTGRFGVLYWPELPLFLAGMIVLVRRRQPSDRLMLWWLMAFPLAPALTEGRPPDWLRSSAGLPAFDVIAAVGGAAAWQWLLRPPPPDPLPQPWERGNVTRASARVMLPRLHAGASAREEDPLPSPSIGGGAGGGGRSKPMPRPITGRLRVASLAATLFAIALIANLAWFLHDYTVRFPNRAAWAFHDGIADGVRELARLQPGYQTVVLPRRVPGVHDYYLFYTRYDPAQLQRQGLDDPAPPGAWADVRGFGAVRVCDPRTCCGAGAICLVEGIDPALPIPLVMVRNRTGRVAFSIVAGGPVR